MSTKRLVEELTETKKIKNLVLAKSIYWMDNKFECDPKMDIPIMDMQERRAKKVLYSLFDKDSLRLVKEYDKKILKNVVKIESGEPWVYSYGDFSYTDNYMNMHDYEFRTFDRYTVVRTTEGYIPGDTDPFNGYMRCIIDTEKAFISRHENELMELHRLLSQRESFLSGCFELKDESNRELAKELIYYLGLVKEPKENKEKIKTY